MDFFHPPELDRIGEDGPWSRRKTIVAWTWVALVAVLAVVVVLTQA
jgi:hypothetical protein